MQEPEDPLLTFAESLRSKGGVENRSAVLGGERYELFRGKDLVRWLKAHPDKVLPAVAGGTGGWRVGRAVGCHQSLVFVHAHSQKWQCR